MRTKTMLLTAACVAAGALSSMAQNVYSVNVVGYVNVTLPANQYVMIANPLDTGTGNNITNVITSPLPDSTFLYPFTNPGGFGSAEEYVGGFGWYPGVTTLSPGSGFFIISPIATNITFVGTVVQGPVTNTLNAGYSIIANPSAVSLPLGAAGITDPTQTMALPVQDSDGIYLWNVANQQYVSEIQYVGGFGWYDPSSVYGTNGPSPAVAQAFFLYKQATSQWVDQFTVQ